MQKVKNKKIMIFLIACLLMGSFVSVDGFTLNVKAAEAPSSPDDDSKDISVKNMVAISGNEHSQTGTEGPDDNVLDDDPNTIWHTKHGVEPTGGSVLENRWIGVNLDTATTVNGIRCLPRQDASGNGIVTEYEIQYRETDDGKWTTVAGGKWEDYNDIAWKYVGFSAVTAKQIRLIGVYTYSGKGLNRHMSCAEFRVTGVDIDVPSSGDDGNEGGELALPEKDITVNFSNDYAEVGKVLSVTSDAQENVSYVWKVNGKQVSTSAFYTPTVNDLEKWIEVEVISAGASGTAKMYCSKLPVVYIDTENGAPITSKENYINADMKVQGNSNFNEEDILYDNVIEIKGRGNSTWSKPKKPYRLKLDKKTNMFNMGKSKHWVLLANYLDESLMRNTLAYDLSGSMDMEQMSTVWVDVVMNGEYVGNYQFCENIRIDDTRVDIFDWEDFAEESAETIAETEGMNEDDMDDLIKYMTEINMQWITSGYVDFNDTRYYISNYSDIEMPSSINGGYLLELDEYYDEVSKFRTNSGQPIMFKSPEFVGTNSDMMTFVQSYVQAFEDAVQAEDYKTFYEGEQVHYSELYDFDALVDYWLITEVFYNEEINKKSTYMYKDIDGLMMMGPIWDMDWSSGAAGTAALATDKWATNNFNVNAQRYQWYKYLVQDPYFLIRAQERYWEIRDVQVQDMLDVIDVHIDYLKESGQADYETWRAKAGRSTSFASDSANLKSWLNTHVAWMDEQMATEDSFDSAFLGKNKSLILTLKNTAGELENHKEGKVPADVVMMEDEEVKLHMSGMNGTAKVFVNGKERVVTEVVSAGTDTSIIAEWLNASDNKKNVIEVKIYNVYGDVIAANYITVNVKKALVENMPVTDAFVDVVEGAWYVNSVQYVYDEGIIVGDGNIFAPDNGTTRAMVAVILYRLAGSPEVTEADYREYNRFGDLPKEKAWYSDAVAWALKEKVSTGDDYAMLYNPESFVTREQLALFLWRYAKYNKEDVTVTATKKELFGETYVNSWAEEGFAWAVDREIIRGAEETDGEGNLYYVLNPQGGATRAQLARMLHRYLGGTTE